MKEKEEVQSPKWQMTRMLRSNNRRIALLVTGAFRTYKRASETTTRSVLIQTGEKSPRIRNQNRMRNETRLLDSNC